MSTLKYKFIDIAMISTSLILSSELQYWYENKEFHSFSKSKSMHTMIYIIFHVNTVVSNKDAFSCRLMYLFLQLHWIQISYYVSIKRKIHSYIRTKTIYCIFYRIFHKQAEKSKMTADYLIQMVLSYFGFVVICK